MRKLMIGLLIASVFASVAAGADEMTIFDELHRLDATALDEHRRASQVQAQMTGIDQQLEERWAAVDVALRAASPIRTDVTQGLARWLSAYRNAEREAMDAPQAGADTRRLLGYAAARALPLRLRNVDVVRRADAERDGFASLMAQRARWSVEFARTNATADAASGARDVLVAEARSGAVPVDFAATDDEFQDVLRSLPSAGLTVDFHRLKGTLARPLAQSPEFSFGAQAPLMRPGGLTYRSQPGEDVHAVHDGEVVFVGAAQGWGLVVVVDHGGGYVSIYAHLDQARVELGGLVERADVVAAAGDSGSLDGPRLYFELRHGDKPVDPSQWFLKR